MMSYSDYIDINEKYILDEKGIIRENKIYSKQQEQTKDTFAYKWRGGAHKSSYKSETVYQNLKEWLWDKYFDNNEEFFLRVFAENAIVLDAGCGAGLSASALISDRMNSIQYIGVDISYAIDEAYEVFVKKGYTHCIFIQGDLNSIPLKTKVDVIFSEGVLHHADSTRNAIINLSKHLKNGGYFCFYVYAKKAPIREFTDDYIRGYFKDKDNEQTWDELEALTRFGKKLGDMNIVLDIDDDIPFLGIKKGRIDLQRFFYWNIFKCYYRPEYNLEEMNHINFDWYRPTNCHRQTPEEVSKWCEEAGLEIERMHVEEAGITVVAKKIN